MSAPSAVHLNTTALRHKKPLRTRYIVDFYRQRPSAFRSQIIKPIFVCMGYVFLTIILGGLIAFLIVDSFQILKTYQLPAGIMITSIFVLLTVFAYWRWWRSMESTAIRYATFSRNNRLSIIQATKPDTTYKASLFHQGQTRRILTELRASSPYPYSFGRYVYTVGYSGAFAYQKPYAFVRMRLPRPMPHITLMSKGSNAPTATPKHSQKQLLEGNFNDFFTLYCPEKYGADVRYVFTPDLMAYLIDHFRVIHIEIVDDEVCLYYEPSKETFFSEDDIRNIEYILNTLYPRLIKRTKLYTDDRTSDLSAVAPEGKRMRIIRWDIVIALILLMVYIALKAGTQIWKHTG